jgi:outer membrane protein assembly factor BamB
MLIKRLFSYFLLVAVLSSCSSASEQHAERSTQVTEDQETITPTPDIKQDFDQPTQAFQGTQVLRSLLGTEQGEVATSVIELEEGGFLVAGYDYDKSENISEWDALVMRISPDGNQVWRRSTDRSGSEYAWVVREAQDDLFVVVGTRESEDGDTDGYMQGIDADGNEIWLRTYGGEKNEILWAAEPTPDSGFILAGQTNSEGAGNWDFYIVRTDLDGNALWSKSFGTPVIDRAFGIGVSPDGGALIAGFTGNNPVAMNFFFLRINKDGRELWRRTIAGDRFDVAHDVLRLADGGFVISGYTSSFSPGDHDGFLMRLSAEGRMLWMKTYGDAGDDRILHVAQLDDEGFALVGYSNWDMVVWRVDPNGDLMWSYRDGGSLPDVGKDIIIARNGSIVAVGGNRSENPPFDDIILLILKG